MLAIVPGVADAPRAAMVAANLDHLRPRGCVTFTHKRCGEDGALDAMLDVGARPPVGGASA